MLSGGKNEAATSKGSVMAALRPAVDLEAESRAVLWRRLHAEDALEAARAAEARRAAELAIEARIAMQVQGRLCWAIARLQPLVSRIEAHLRDEQREAARAGEHGRRLAIEHELDALFGDLNQAMRMEAGR
jgi:hypothetical protein